MKKRLTSLVIALCMAFTMLPAFTLTASAVTETPITNGDGSASNPYKISKASELEWFRTQVNNGRNTICGELTNDIDLSSDTSWTPIGTTNRPYSGTFDGRNYYIKNLTFNGTITVHEYGFFGAAKDATIKNVHITGNINATGFSLSGFATLAGVVGAAVDSTWDQDDDCKATLRISNCSFDGNITVSFSNAYVAGILAYMGDGFNNVHISNCFSSGQIQTTTNKAYVCGLFGTTSDCGYQLEIRECYTTATLIKSGDVFPFAGNSNDATINLVDCYSTSDYNTSLSLSAIDYSYADRIFYYHDNHKNITKHDFYGMFYSHTLGTTYSNIYTNTGTGNTTLTDTQFADASAVATNFPTWDFQNTWKMGAKYPILKPKTQDVEAWRKTVTAESGETATYDLSRAFLLINDETQNYTQSGRFKYEILSGNEVTVDEDTVAVASVADGSDLLTVSADAPLGTHTLKVRKIDETGSYDNYDFDVTVNVIKTVPVPEVSGDGFPFSTAMRLSFVDLTRPWKWTNGTICPTGGNYEAYYKLDDGTTIDNYDWTAVKAAYPSAAYDSASNRIKVSLPVEVTESDESPRALYFKVVNADTGANVAGAKLSCEYSSQFPQGNTTSESVSRIYAEMSKGEHEVTATADGFQTNTVTVTVKESNTEDVVIKLTPERGSYTTPSITDEDGNDITDGKLVITRIGGEGGAAAWEEENGGKSVVVDAGDDVELPEGTYEIHPATDGYSTDEVIYAIVDQDGNITYYSSLDPKTEAETDPETGLPVLSLTTLGDPTYTVTVKPDAADETKYIATVQFSGVKATYGTFGMRYDKNLFTLDADSDGEPDITMDDNLVLVQTPHDVYSGTTGVGNWNTNEGYYVFTWQAGGYGDAEELNGETGKQNVATLTFTLKNPADAELITIDTFGIEPWQDTQEYKAYIKANPTAEDISSQFWRYCDTDNNKLSLKTGRLEKSKAVVNGLDMNGFFQAAVNGAAGGTISSYSYDVKTDLILDFDIKNSVIKFHVTDRDDGTELFGALLRLFDTEDVEYDEKDTDESGMATFAVDTSDVETKTFSYDVSRFGYWPLPLSGVIQDRPWITAVTGRAILEEVQLEKRVYHKPLLRSENGENDLELVKDADLGGEKYAYNGRDFHFRVKGAQGYAIAKYPDKATVYVQYDGTRLEKLAEVGVGDDDLFTLSGELLDQEELDDTTYWKSISGYEDVTTIPDIEGFRSYNLVIVFDDYDAVEKEYLVEGQTNALGHVTYDDTNPEGSLSAQPTDKTGDDLEDITVKTIVSDSENGIAANRQTGTFTFEGDSAEDIVEKVYINGLEVDTYNGEHKFEYSFGKVDRDNSIIVIFWDGVNPSEDTVMTLVVGEYGSVNLSAPEEIDGLTNTTRTFLNAKKLDFVTVPDDGYELNDVRKEVDGGESVSIKSGADYSVPMETGAKDVTVYVTFKNPLAETTPNLFVKSYVHTGTGNINPEGIQVVTMHDSVEFDLTTGDSDSWMVKGVMLSPYEDLPSTREWDFASLSKSNKYRYDDITDSMAIGAIFVEKAYTLTGTVDLSQNSTVTTAAPKTGATLTFVRVKDVATGAEDSKAAVFKATTAATRKNAAFSVDLPAGTWNVYVTKPGYVKYVIKNFTYDPDTTEGAENIFGNSKTIVPFIGSTETGTTVSLTDAANIKSGMRKNVSTTIFDRADVDNDGKVLINDMTYVMKNFNKQMVTQDYGTFCTDGSNMVTPNLTILTDN